MHILTPKSLPIHACDGPAIVRSPKIYDPAPGAINVPITPGTLIVANSLDKYGVPFVGIFVPIHSSAPIVRTTVLAQFLPPGSPPAAMIFESATYPQLVPGTRYQIRFEGTNGGRCAYWTTHVVGFTTT